MAMYMATRVPRAFNSDILLYRFIENVFHGQMTPYCFSKSEDFVFYIKTEAPSKKS